MKHGGKMLVCLAGSLAWCVVATARTSEGAGDPYQAIVERNVFGLKPPPPPPDPEANKPPLPKITLTGITTVLGSKRALMKLPPTPAKPGEPAKTEQGFILAVGERQGEVEVLEIDEIAGSVKVNYGGTVTDLTFDKDGVKAVPAPGGQLPPGMVAPKTVMAVPGPMGGPGVGAGQFLARPLRLPGPTGPVSPQGAVAAVSGAGVNVGGAPVNLSGSGAAATTSGTTQPAGPVRSAEENLLMLEANRLRHQDEIRAGRWPPLPRHPLTDTLYQDSGAATTAPATPQVPRLPLSPGAARQYVPPAAQ
jgi:hypothetical protein